MKRVILFLATNLAVILVLSITLRLLGVERILDAQGVDLDLKALLVFAAVFGMGGSFISLALSKWTAKRFTGAQVIGRPSNATEEWLVETVRRQAQAAGIGMPQVAVFESPAPNAFAMGARRNHALVAVSTGLLQRMPREEVEAVLGHEVSHVATRCCWPPGRWRPMCGPRPSLSAQEPRHQIAWLEYWPLRPRGRSARRTGRAASV